MDAIQRPTAIRLSWGGLVLLLILAAFVLIPLPLVDKFYAIGFGICPQRPAHSYFLGGSTVPGEMVARSALPLLSAVMPDTPTKLPVEARMYGMFAGFLITWLYIFWRGRGRAAVMPPPLVLLAFISFIAVMGADGINATIFDLNKAGLPIPYAYAPRLDLRFITGWLCGIGMAGIVLPVVNYSLWKNAQPNPMFDRARDLLPLALIGTLILGILTTGSGVFYYPLAVLAPVGILVTLGSLNVVLALTLGHHERFAANWGETLNPIAIALLLSLAELALLSLMRYSAFGLGDIV